MYSEIMNREKDQFQKLRHASEAIIMLPFAGGSSYSYKKITQFFSPETAVICPELPGRGVLSDLPCISSIEALADYVFENCIRHLNQNCRYIIYGHSMGALLAYLLAHKICEQGLHLPKHLVVSGRRGPGFEMKRDLIHHLPSDLFREKIGLMGGTPGEVLADEELMDYFEPILRSDIKAVETYVHVRKRQLDIPIDILYGSQEHMPEGAIESWQNESTEAIKVTKMMGNHFFIFDAPEAIAAYLSKTFESARLLSSVV